MRRNRRFYKGLLLLMMMMLVLAACGSKSQESVSKKIEKQLTQLTGYKAVAEMTMKTGREERTYHINVWFQKGDQDFYRVDLTNQAEDHEQTILKNAEGVFVLTPLMNKSFKFQSDWPEKNGQPYLYQSLIQDIAEDKDAIFTAGDDHYMFKTKTNYMNQTHLPYQQVYFDKKTYLPMYVQVLGEEEQPLIEVKFNEIKTNPTFTEADFDREAILKAGNSGEEDSNSQEKEDETTAEANATETSPKQQELLLPVVTKGAELVETEKIKDMDSHRTISTFKGERNFTLIQEETEAVPVSADGSRELEGDPVFLGHSIGALSEGVVEWNYNGSQFYLASEELTVDELIDVASSVYGRGVK